MLTYRTFRAFWVRVQKTPSGCWLWTGAPNVLHGYGYVRADGRVWRVHRLAYTFRYGPIPDGLAVLHRCDVRMCCRPSHLFLGTQADNIQDMITKGRRGNPRTPGEQHPRHKLTVADVHAILAAPLGYGTATALARRYGVHVNRIHGIRAGREWRTVL